MRDDEIEPATKKYEKKLKIPTTDVLKHGPGKLTDEIERMFIDLKRGVPWNDISIFGDRS